MNNVSRRQVIKYLSLVSASLLTQHTLAADDVAAPNIDSTAAPFPSVPPLLIDSFGGNFSYIYRNTELREQFFNFLVNVFRLYPEHELHALIQSFAESYSADENVYKQLQQNIGNIKPFLSELTFALPALNKQKLTMRAQTCELLDTNRRYEGYLEIGSSGRYVDALEEDLNIVGERFFLAEQTATYSLSDMIDRGQIMKAGTHIPLANYASMLGDSIPSNSLDLVTVYIGFHHCPLALREQFISDIRDAMKPGAYLIVRDHDAHNEDMQAIVGLAHDVFNMGTDESWDYNANELRNFYSLRFLDEWLSSSGFRGSGEKLYQSGDPTHNALMVYQKA
ncbi:class I SAM-dependent methyltransferase [Zhongshania aquimaris]|uniref:Class I SAM-dependent methyltransferase n=1 Tax=Zhongshania aquimaris TaxID=2857107 RepID=A0ABS6VP48_9GAMM|nr:class I SAM-dependent methyltransferase [Zhongshania aquimaris]MBW2939818.1 class I SAM-dependent methyltransferase [Zhongshania aquimaris]